MTELAEGEEFAGYVIERRLGAGGMGEVYLAKHPRLPRHDALKVLAPQFTHDDQYRSRFEREAELVAGLRHPAIVTVHDRGETDGRLWIAMTYIEGQDLAQRLRASGPLTAQQTTLVTSTIADALDRAHARGLVHRDVKPANILLGVDGDVVLVDFGIARSQLPETSLTATGIAVGTLDFGSPEQLQGLPVDGRSDQYSLGCTAFALLTGRAPFADTSAARVVANQLGAPLPSVRQHRPELTPAVDAVLTRATAKDPAARFATSSAFATALASALASTRTPVNSPTPVASSMPQYTPTAINRPGPPGPGQMPIPGPPARPAAVADPGRRRRTGTRVAITVGVVVALILGAGLWIGLSATSDGDYDQEATDAARALDLPPVTPFLPSLATRPPASTWIYEQAADNTGFVEPVTVVGATSEDVLVSRRGAIDIVDAKTATRRGSIDVGRDHVMRDCVIADSDRWVVCQGGGLGGLTIIDLDRKSVVGAVEGFRDTPEYLIDGDTLIAVNNTADESWVRGFDRTGRELWAHDSQQLIRLGGPVLQVTPPQGDDPLATEQLVAISVPDGKEIVRVDRPKGMFADDFTAYTAGFYLGGHFYDADGTKRAAAPSGWSPMHKAGDHPATPAPALPLFSDGKSVAAIDPETGEILWSRKLEGVDIAGVTAVGDQIVLTDFRSDTDGARRFAWYHTATGVGRDITLPKHFRVLGTDGTRLVGVMEEEIRAYGPDSDQPLWAITIGDGWIYLAEAGGHIYVGGKRIL